MASDERSSPFCPSVNLFGHLCQDVLGHAGLHFSMAGKNEVLSWSDDQARKPGEVSSTVAYAFLQQRPADKQAYPTIYQDQKLAETCTFRVSDVVPVVLNRRFKEG